MRATASLKTPCVQPRRPHSPAVRGGATPGRWGPAESPALPQPCFVPIACPSERTTTVNNGATSPSHLPPDNEFSQVRGPTSTQAPSLPKLMAPYAELSSSREQLPHSHSLPAQALPDSLHGAWLWGDTAGTNVRKPGRMERLLPSARWRRSTRPKPTCLYSSPTSARAGASRTAAARQSERLVLEAEVGRHGLVRGATQHGKPTPITVLAGPSLGRPRLLDSGQCRPTTTARHTSPPPPTSKNPAHQDPLQDPGQEEVTSTITPPTRAEGAERGRSRSARSSRRGGCSASRGGREATARRPRGAGPTGPGSDGPR